MHFAYPDGFPRGGLPGPFHTIAHQRLASPDQILNGAEAIEHHRLFQ
jgi:hypothetical protein